MSAEVRDLVRDAATWRLLGLSFERPRGEWATEIAALVPLPGDERMTRLGELAVEQANEQAFLEVLGPGGAVSPREVGYSVWVDPGHLLASVEAMYEAFAYQPATEECLDHVSVEAGFVGYLRMKEAFARSNGDDEAAAIAAEAARVFLDEHLRPLAHGIYAKFADDETFYFALAAKLLREHAGDGPVRTAPASPLVDEDGEPSCGGDCSIS
jgi:TorA maturation chaperone TorD